MGKVQNLQLISLDKIPELKAQTIQLIESEFGYVNPNSFEIDFAPLHTTNNLQNCWILYDEKNQKVIAHIGLLPQKIFIRNQEYPIIFLGGIVVGKQHRGKGLFTILMRHIIEKYSRSCAFFLLWSDKQELYKKFNFFSAIAQIESIPQNNFNYFLKKHNFVKTIFRDLSYKEKSQIKKLYNKKNKKRMYRSH